MCAAIVSTAVMSGGAAAAGSAASAFTLNSYLSGAWQLRKRLEYRRGGNFGSWEGIATFRPVDTGSGPGGSATTAPGSPGEATGAEERGATSGGGDQPFAMTPRNADGTVPYPNLAALEAGGCDNSLIYEEDGLL